ncbi:unnamed protein product [Meganyctiphanes norvegica]|uniref:Uncharacterized protein n=1 Tax=Meganyctiphanes norvegica TaxID=48144 RepID=A0AAV2QQ04_MEGNR
MDDFNSELTGNSEELVRQNEDLAQTNAATREVLRELLNDIRNSQTGFEGVTGSAMESLLQLSAQEALAADNMQEQNSDVANMGLNPQEQNSDGDSMALNTQEQNSDGASVALNTQVQNPDATGTFFNTEYQLGDQVGFQRISTNLWIDQEVIPRFSTVNQANVEDQYQYQQMVIGGIIFKDFFFCIGRK